MSERSMFILGYTLAYKEAVAPTLAIVNEKTSQLIISAVANAAGGLYDDLYGTDAEVAS